MKSTTGSKLAEQNYSDYLRETAPTDKKLNTSFQFNEYSRHFGLPLKLTPTSPQGIAKLCRNVVTIYSRWLSNEINEAWGLGTW